MNKREFAKWRRKFLARMKSPARKAKRANGKARKVKFALRGGGRKKKIPTIDKDDLKNIDLITHRYKNNIIIMMIYLVEEWSGKIKLKEKQELSWINRKQIKDFGFLPGSQIIFDRIYENYYKFFK